VLVQTLVLLAALLVLPTVWLRDLSLLSFLSVGGIFASVALLALVGWEGTAVTSFTHQHPPFVSWSGVPVTLGLFLFCFSGELLACGCFPANSSPWFLSTQCQADPHVSAECGA
jgi:vesicular inhibitory amino acid transporter